MIGVGKSKQLNLDVRNIFAGSQTEHCWRCSCIVHSSTMKYIYLYLTRVTHGIFELKKRSLAVCRISIAQEIWQCCKALFLHGTLQRRDAYMILSVFAELFFPCVQFTLENSSSPSTDQTPWKFSAENFDIRDDPLFWDKLKAGLVRKITVKVPSFSPGLKSQ